MKTCSCLLLVSAVLIVVAVSSAQESTPENLWVVKGFDDFSLGEVGAGGANLYVSHRGSVEMIHRFDLNSDGYLDIVFNQTHDYKSRIESVIFWNGERGFQPSVNSPLDTDGGYKSRVYDLNDDGYMDLVVANRFNGTTHRLDSFVYWGSQDGLRANLRTSLPTIGAVAVAVGDLNRDGYADLVFANGGTVLWGTQWLLDLEPPGASNIWRSRCVGR